MTLTQAQIVAAIVNAEESPHGRSWQLERLCELFPRRAWGIWSGGMREIYAPTMSDEHQWATPIGLRSYYDQDGPGAGRSADALIAESKR